MPTLGHCAQIQTDCAPTILNIARALLAFPAVQRFCRKSELARCLLHPSRDRLQVLWIGDPLMSESRDANAAVENDHRTLAGQESKLKVQDFSRRTFLGVGSAGIATVALASLAANAQERSDIEKGIHDHSASNPGPENKPLLDENPNSNLPPPTDSGNLEPVWYSFDLTHKRVQEGGWTNEVTQKVLPSSKDIAGVRMRDRKSV